MYGAITHYGRTSQSVPLSTLELKGWSDFARRYFRNLGWFLFLRVLRCFSSPGSPPHTYVFSVGYPTDVGWVSPFGNVRIKACLPAPLTLSQVSTSFIASDCQGIHRMRLVAWPYNPKQFYSKTKQTKDVQDFADYDNSPDTLLLRLQVFSEKYIRLLNRID